MSEFWGEVCGHGWRVLRAGFLRRFRRNPVLSEARGKVPLFGSEVFEHSVSPRASEQVKVF